MKIIKDLRRKYNFTQKHLASLLGVSQQAVANWESGRARPSIANLRDLAIIFNTSVDILSNPTVELKDVTERWYHFQVKGPEAEEGYYFWGHIGLGLPRFEYSKWYPITAHTANRVARALRSGSGDLISLETLNNRSLTIHKQNIHHIYLLDENADAITGDWNLGWDSYDGYPTEVYQALVDKFFYGTLKESDYSANLVKLIDDIIAEHDLDDQKVMEYVEYSYIHTLHRDYQHQLSSEALNEAWLCGLLDSNEYVDLGDLDSGYSLFLWLNHLVLLDVPTHQMDELDKMLEEEEGLIEKE